MKQKKSLSYERTDAMATTQDARNVQLAYKAEMLAEQRVEDGTASNDLLQFLMRRADRESQLKLEQLERQNKLLEAKCKALESVARSEELFGEAMAMFKKYKGIDDEYEN